MSQPSYEFQCVLDGEEYALHLFPDRFVVGDSPHDYADVSAFDKIEDADDAVLYLLGIGEEEHELILYASDCEEFQNTFVDYVQLCRDDLDDEYDDDDEGHHDHDDFHEDDEDDVDHSDIQSINGLDYGQMGSFFDSILDGAIHEDPTPKKTEPEPPQPNPEPVVQKRSPSPPRPPAPKLAATVAPTTTKTISKRDEFDDEVDEEEAQRVEEKIQASLRAKQHAKSRLAKRMEARFGGGSRPALARTASSSTSMKRPGLARTKQQSATAGTSMSDLGALMKSTNVTFTQKKNEAMAAESSSPSSTPSPIDVSSSSSSPRSSPTEDRRRRMRERAAARAAARNTPVTPTASSPSPPSPPSTSSRFAFATPPPAPGPEPAPPEEDHDEMEVVVNVHSLDDIPSSDGMMSFMNAFPSSLAPAPAESDPDPEPETEPELDSAQLLEARAKLKTSTERIRALKTEKSEFERRLKTTEDQRDQKQTKVEELTHTISTQLEELNQLKENHVEELSSMRSAFGTEKETLENEIERLKRTEIDRLEAEVRKMRIEVRTAVSDAETAQKKSDADQEEISSLRAELFQTKSVLSSKMKLVSSLRNDLETVTEEKEQLMAATEGAEELNRVMEEQQHHHREALESLQKLLDEAKEANCSNPEDHGLVISLQAQVADLAEENESLSSAAFEALDGGSMEDSEQKEVIDTLQNRNMELQEEIAELRKKTLSPPPPLTEAQGSTDLLGRIEELEQQLREKTEELADVHSQLDSLHDEQLKSLFSEDDDEAVNVQESAPEADIEEDSVIDSAYPESGGEPAIDNWGFLKEKVDALTAQLEDAQAELEATSQQRDALIESTLSFRADLKKKDRLIERLRAATPRKRTSPPRSPSLSLRTRRDESFFDTYTGAQSPGLSTSPSSLRRNRSSPVNPKRRIAALQKEVLHYKNKLYLLEQDSEVMITRFKEREESDSTSIETLNQSLNTVEKAAMEVFESRCHRLMEAAESIFPIHRLTETLDRYEERIGNLISKLPHIATQMSQLSVERNEMEESGAKLHNRLLRLESTAQSDTRKRALRSFRLAAGNLAKKTMERRRRSTRSREPSTDSIDFSKTMPVGGFGSLSVPSPDAATPDATTAFLTQFTPAETQLETAKKKIGELGPNEMHELTAYRRPPEVVMTILRRTLVFLGQSERDVREWTQCRKLIVGGRLKNRIMEYTPGSEDKIGRLRSVLSSTDRSKVFSVSLVVGRIYDFLRSCVRVILKLRKESARAEREGSPSSESPSTPQREPPSPASASPSPSLSSPTRRRRRNGRPRPAHARLHSFAGVL